MRSEIAEEYEEDEELTLKKAKGKQKDKQKDKYMYAPLLLMFFFIILLRIHFIPNTNLIISKDLSLETFAKKETWFQHQKSACLFLLPVLCILCIPMRCQNDSKPKMTEQSNVPLNQMLFLSNKGSGYKKMLHHKICKK